MENTLLTKVKDMVSYCVSCMKELCHVFSYVEYISYNITLRKLTWVEFFYYDCNRADTQALDTLMGNTQKENASSERKMTLWKFSFPILL